MGELEVGAHALGDRPQTFDERDGAVLQVVEQDRRVGQDHALDRGVRDVALVPQRDVLKRRLARCRAARVPARQICSLLIGLRLCGIAARALLARAEGLLRPRATSVRCRWRISVARRSRPAPASAMALSSSAWRSRATTWVETSSRAQAEALAARAPRTRGPWPRTCRPRPRQRPDGGLREGALEALRRCGGPRRRSPRA